MDYGIVKALDNSYYVSGFLYNLKTKQILLLQSEPQTDTALSWSMLGGEAKKGEEAPEAFQRIISEILEIELKPKHIYPIYDYFHDALKKVNYVFYAEVGKGLKINPAKEGTLSWVTFSETIKLMFPMHTKQDVIVGQRVIDAKKRKKDEAREQASL